MAARELLDRHAAAECSRRNSAQRSTSSTPSSPPRSRRPSRSPNPPGRHKAGGCIFDRQKGMSIQPAPTRADELRPQPLRREGDLHKALALRDVGAQERLKVARFGIRAVHLVDIGFGGVRGPISELLAAAKRSEQALVSVVRQASSAASQSGALISSSRVSASGSRGRRSAGFPACSMSKSTEGRDRPGPRLAVARCTVHFLRDLRGHCRKDQHDALGALIRQLFTAPDGADARRRLADAISQAPRPQQRPPRGPQQPHAPDQSPQLRLLLPRGP